MEIGLGSQLKYLETRNTIKIFGYFLFSLKILLHSQLQNSPWRKEVMSHNLSVGPSIPPFLIFTPTNFTILECPNTRLRSSTRAHALCDSS